MSNFDFESNVLVFTRYSSTIASSRIRYINPIIDSTAIRAHFNSLLPDSLVLKRNSTKHYSQTAILLAYLNRIKFILVYRKFRYWFIEAEIFPLLPYSFEGLILKLLRVNAIYDFDDDWLESYKSKYPKLYNLYIKRKFRAISNNHFLTVSNENLNSSLTSREVTVSKVFQTFEHLKPNLQLVKKLPQRFSVGWIGTPMSANQQLSNYLELLRRIDSEFSLTLIGAGEKFKILGFNVADWTLETETDLLNECSIGLMPLERNTFNDSKSFLKAYQFLSLGRPVIVDNYPLEIAENSGFIRAKSCSDFLRILKELSQNRQDLEILSQMASQHVAEILRSETMESFLINHWGSARKN